MEIFVSLLLGIIIGSAITYYILRKKKQRKTIREYETQIKILKDRHQLALEEARNRSIDESRAVIEGKKAIEAGKVGFERVNFNTVDEESLNSHNNSTKQDSTQKAYSIKAIRKTHPRAYKLWTRDEEERLIKLYKQGMTIKDLACEFQRQSGGIRSRLKKLGLL